MAIQIELCPHRANPKACPLCYRLKPPDPKPTHHAAASLIPTGTVIPIGEATLRATQNAARARINNQVGVGANVKVLKEPYSSANLASPPDAYSEDKVWQPPAHPSQIDSRPVHPHLNESKVLPR
jgi:hypothetical protein